MYRAKRSTVSRRDILKSAAVAAGGLVIGFHLPGKGRAQAPASKAYFAPNAFLRIAPDDTVTIVVKHVEWGMGVHTALAMIIAEELDADWERVRIEPAPANAELYSNLVFGFQGTAGSNSIRNSWIQHRQAGAAARAMLVAAAAREWGVAASEITVERQVVAHAATGRRAPFGELAETAATLSPPVEVTLKDAARFALIGKEGIRRIDSPSKIDGTAEFAIDIKLPGMLTATVVRPPRFGATVASFDASAALAMPGVRHVVQIPTGVAVLADSFWAALRGREAVAVDWEETGAERRGTPELLAEYRARMDRPGAVARRDGDVAGALAGAARTLEASFEFPYLAHAMMEPITCVVQLSADRCDIWTGDGAVQFAQEGAAKSLGLRNDQVHIHSVYCGGSFGRRDSTPQEAVEIAKAIKGSAPVKLIWTRKDDISGGMYRPMYLHKLTVGLDAKGDIAAWHHTIAGQSLFPWEPINGVDFVSVSGAANLPYAIPNILVDLHTTENGITIATWRGNGDNHTAFAVETMLDDVARETGRDPLELRRSLLAHDPYAKQIDMLSIAAADRPAVFPRSQRHLGVLDLAADRAGWGTPLPAGRGRGIAVHYSYYSSVAMVAEVTVASGGAFKVDRVVCAIDCGIAVNPDIVRAQMEGSIAFGLGAMLHGAITLDQGVVQQSSFEDYPVLRMNEMPRVEVHVVHSTEPPTGAGEPGVPPIAPAVANALFAATGRRVRTLPFDRI